jgi:hypothetical protein
MDPDVLSEVVSSRVRLKLVGSIAVRPRTLGELSSLTGISVQGVLRHLDRLMDLGLVGERKIVANAPKARKLYAAKTSLLGDYSDAGVIIVKPTDSPPTQAPGRRRPQDLEKMAGELLIMRRRIGVGARKLGRMIDDLVTAQAMLDDTLDSMNLSNEERLILGVVLTEETVEDGAKVLSKYYGIDDRRSIDNALAKARRLGSK